MPPPRRRPRRPPLRELAVDERPINLTQALKLAGSVDHGGMAKALISEGLVKVNGEVELRKRRKLAVGDLIETPDGGTLKLVPSSPPDSASLDPPPETGPSRPP